MKKERRWKRALGLCLACLVALPAVPAFAAQERTFQVVHTNDIHGYYTGDEEDGTLGFAWLKTMVEETGADLVFDGGDTFHGQTFATISQGESIAALMGAVGYDATTPGNHDFSYGAQQLKTLEQVGGFPVLAANIQTEDGSAFFETPYLVKEVTADDGSSVRVGVLGVVDDAFYTSTPAKRVAGLTFAPEAEKATEVAKTLRQEEDCDVVICLTHQADLEGFVAQTEGIDVVVAGHEHLVMQETYADSQGEDVFVAEAGSSFLQTGLMEITVDDNGEVCDVQETVYDRQTNPEMKENAAVAEQIAALEKEQSQQLAQPVAQLAVDYPYQWEEVRVRQMAIGRLVTESYLQATGADVALENAGGIRGGLTAGEVTYGQLVAVSPYGNGLVTKTLTGKDLKAVLQQAVAFGAASDAVYTTQKEAVAKGEDPYQYSWPDNNGSYLQWAGVTLFTDENDNITEIWVGDAPLDEAKTYRIATNEYVAGSENFPQLANAPLEQEHGTCLEALIAHVEPMEETPLNRQEAAAYLQEAANALGMGQEVSLQGYEDGALRQEQPVTGVEALVLLERTFGPVSQSQTTSEALSTVPQWAQETLSGLFSSPLADEAEMMMESQNVTEEQLQTFVDNLCRLLQQEAA